MCICVWLCGRSYPGITCHAFLEEVRQAGGGADAGGGGRGRSTRGADRSGESLVRDRLAFPSFLLLLPCPGVPESLCLEACGLCLCFAWTHDGPQFSRGAETSVHCFSYLQLCVWAIFSQLAPVFSCTRICLFSPSAVRSVIQYHTSVAASRHRARQSPLIHLSSAQSIRLAEVEVAAPRNTMRSPF